MDFLNAFLSIKNQSISTSFFSFGKNLLTSFALVFALSASALGNFPYYQQSFTQSTVEESDIFRFGRLWSQIKRIEEDGILCEMISKRRNEIAEIKAHWRAKIQPHSDKSFASDVMDLVRYGHLEASSQGCGSAYILKDRENHPRYVLKPIDEDIFCLNNRKQYSSPFNNKVYRARGNIPLYRSAQAETLSYAFATLLGFNTITPHTFMMVVTHPNFYDLSDALDPYKRESIIEQIGPPEKEKFCSVQEFLTDIRNLYEVIQELIYSGINDQKILPLFDRDSFENLCLFIWLLYDTDAHASNLYVRQDSKGLYHLLKIDNGLTFPDTNSRLMNALYFFPHAKLPPTPRLRNIIANLPVDQMADLIRFYEMDDALNAFLDRVEVIQKLALRTDCSLREIDMRLHALELPEGKEVALNEDISIQQIETMMSYP